jgi:hypothetical protein
MERAPERPSDDSDDPDADLSGAGAGAYHVSRAMERSGGTSTCSYAAGGHPRRCSRATTCTLASDVVEGVGGCAEVELSDNTGQLGSLRYSGGRARQRRLM